MSAPWWYSGDEESAPADGEPLSDAGDGGPTAGTPVDWTVLAAGAQRLVEWATERVMAPHADHDNPADHPQCVVCRTLVVIGDRTAASPAASPPPERSTSAGIVWIPIVEEPTEP